MPIRVEIYGLRDMRGRFASMLDHKLVEIELQEARETSNVIQQIYRRAAPRSRGNTLTGRHFAEGLTADAAILPGGFEITLGTDNPRLAQWLREGTGIYGPTGKRIFPKHQGAPRRDQHGRFQAGRKPAALGPIMNWIAGGHTGPVFFRSIAGMRANPWEEVARAEAEPFVDHMASQIGVRVADGLVGAL